MSALQIDDELNQDISALTNASREELVEHWNLTYMGTRLVREWNGRSHTVEVLDKGYLWNGDVYKSLSAIASAITGARWSGPRFFGL